MQNTMQVITISYEGTIIIKITSIICHINIQVTSSSKNVGHVVIQARSNFVIGI